jgi:hypothetical protein
VKDNGEWENYVAQKFIDELKRQGAASSPKDAGWMIVETANVNTEDDIEIQGRVKLKLRLAAAYVSEADFIDHDIKGFDSVLSK